RFLLSLPRPKHRWPLLPKGAELWTPMVRLLRLPIPRQRDFRGIEMTSLINPTGSANCFDHGAIAMHLDRPSAIEGPQEPRTANVVRRAPCARIQRLRYPQA